MAFGKLELVQRLLGCIAVFPIDGMDAHGVLFGTDACKHIGFPGGHDRIDAIKRFELANIVIGKTQGGNHPDIHEVVIVVIGVGRNQHVRLGHLQTRIEANAQGGNAGDGEEAAQGAADRAPDILREC